MIEISRLHSHLYLLHEHAQLLGGGLRLGLQGAAAGRRARREALRGAALRQHLLHDRRRHAVDQRAVGAGAVHVVQQALGVVRLEFRGKLRCQEAKEVLKVRSLIDDFLLNKQLTSRQ